MAFKLVESAEAHWRAMKAPQLIALVHAGTRVDEGVLVERPEQHESGVGAQIACHADPRS